MADAVTMETPHPPQPGFHSYQALCQDPPEIRIAIIEPSTEWDTPVRFTFHTAPLEDLEGRYEALSYVWGEPKLIFPIHCTDDGSQILVTENLGHALRRLRYRLEPRWLWADALCIDQSNDHEKATQMPLMVEIFGGAKGVVAWLHEDDESIERGMRCVERLSRRPIVYTAEAMDHGVDIHHVLSKRDLADLSVLFGLPYFRRLWIVQELISNPDITLICGQTELTWLRLTMIITSSLLRDPSLVTLRQTAQLWHDYCFETSSPPHILELVNSYASFGCTDHRDRIFAVYALSHGSRTNMKIDYTLDVVATYVNFAMACMRDGWTIGILMAASTRVGTACAELPSWTPDWRISIANSPLPLNSFRSMVHYAGSFQNGLAKFDFKSLQPCSKKFGYPLRVSEEGHLKTKHPLHEFIHTIDGIFAGADQPWSSETDRSNRLWPLLRTLLKPHGFDRAQETALSHCLDARRSGDTSAYDKGIAEDETILTEAIATICKERCFFRAKFGQSKTADFCYGSVNTESGDILLPLKEEHHSLTLKCSVYSMCVLRPCQIDGEQYTADELEVSWIDKIYRIVGEARLFYHRKDVDLMYSSEFPTLRLSLS